MRLTPTTNHGSLIWYFATIITCGRFYFLLLQTIYGAQVQVSPIYLIALTSFLMFTFARLLVPLSCISSSDMLMRLTPTTNHGSLIWYLRSSELLGVVEYGYVQQLLWEWLLIISGNYFVIELSDITIKILSISDNSWNDLLWISSKILFRLILGPRKITYLSLTRSMKEIQFLFSV